MELPDYITIDEVKRVCKLLNIRDWTAMTEPKVLPEEAKAISRPSPLWHSIQAELI